jgi:translation initiation factor 4G
LTTIGKELDKPEMTQQMKSYFDKLDKIINKKPSVITSRIKFMILDVVDLRKNKWVKRRPDNAPKTLDEIHREVKEEEAKSQLEIARLNAEAKKAGPQGQRGPRGQGGFQQGFNSTSDYDASLSSKPTNISGKIKDVVSNNINSTDIFVINLLYLKSFVI